jgi:hypothetical protein
MKDPKDIRIVAYTERGTKLHLVDLPSAHINRRGGRTACGQWGWRHPDFNGSDADVSLLLNAHAACKRCLMAVAKEGRDAESNDR